MKYTCDVPDLKLWNEPEQINNIIQDLDTYKHKIECLELCNNSIGEKCAKALGEKMKNLKYLRKIDLSDCFVSRGGEETLKCLKYLLESIVDKPIKELNLSDNALGITAASGYEFFFQKNTTLEKLSMNNCGMGPERTLSLMKIIKENKSMPLKILNFSRNKMESKGCISISELLKEKKTLKEIKISDNEIDYEGLNSFLNSIKTNENISLIDINNNTLSSKGKSLPELIAALNNIMHLNLSDLTIEDRNIIKKVFEILPQLNKLREFSFEYNLSDLDFDGDKNKKKYITELLDCLLKVNNLKEVHLENNDIPKDLYKKYLPLFKNKGLYLFSCFSQEEQLYDLEDEELDNTDLNK